MLLERPVFSFFSKLIMPLFYDKKFLRGRWFEKSSLGWTWCRRNLWMQKVKGINRDIPFPVSFRNEVSSAENLIFDPDDMNDFNAFGCYFQNFAAKIVIGKGSYIAPNVGLVTANRVLTDLEQHQPGKDIVLGKNCWIGMHSTVLPGVVLGDHTVVGAGSVVTKSFPEGWRVIAGNPAKVIRKLEKPTENENQNTAYPHHGKPENASGRELPRRRPRKAPKISHRRNSKVRENMKGPKTLYVSDLDGTLLRRDQTVSPFTAETINTLTARGMLFSYATARSLVTAKTVTKGLNTHFPLIIYNGAFVRDNVTEEILLANYFDASVYAVLDELFKANIYPIVYANVDGKEHFSFIYEKCTPGLKGFADTRVNDPRTREVYTTEELTRGDLFYITCIGDPQKLAPFYEKYRETYHVVYSKDIYSGEQWLEIMPKTASKANAARELKEKLKCEKLVVFGDGKNDLDMFHAADEAYAVQNADKELKAAATAVIGGNNEDGVAKWLLEHADF